MKKSGGSYTDRKKAVLVSACLMGAKCRYDGTDCQTAVKLVKGEVPVPVCPEQLGGLSTPRPKSTIHGGDGRQVWSGAARVVTEEGARVTEQFITGAGKAVRIAALVGATKAYLKENSPSCGVRFTNEDFERRPGIGVTTALLIASGIKVVGV